MGLESKICYKSTIIFLEVISLNFYFLRVFALLSVSQLSFSSTLYPINSAARLSEVQDVVSRLEGTMDSSRHSMRDRDYVDVRITQCRVKVRNLPGYIEPATFLYVEQALSLSLDAPYRQRFIKISPDRLKASGVVSSIFDSFIAHSELVGFCSKPENERFVEWEQVKDVGCSVFLGKKGDIWFGQTQSNKCPNDWRGAKFATSKVRIYRDGMNSWDQGWDEQGNQIWGAVKGGYDFQKMDVRSTDVELNGIASRMIGRLSSANQNLEKPDQFLNVSFNNCLVDSSHSKLKNELTIFTEQYSNSETFKFRQANLVKIARDSENNLTATYWSPNPNDKFQDFCKLPISERVISRTDFPSSVCVLKFERSGNDFIGKTPLNGCASDYMGSNRLTIEMRLERDKLQLLEQWFDVNNKQVAGSKNGPYIYDVVE